MNHMAPVESLDGVGAVLTESDFLCRPVRAFNTVKLKPISPKSDNQASYQDQRELVNVFRIAPAFCSTLSDERRKDFVKQPSIRQRMEDSISKQRCQQQNKEQKCYKSQQKMS